MAIRPYITLVINVTYESLLVFSPNPMRMQFLLIPTYVTVHDVFLGFDVFHIWYTYILTPSNRQIDGPHNMDRAASYLDSMQFQVNFLR